MKTTERPMLHYATDRRCYNGAPSSDLKREWDSRDRIRRQVMAVEPGFRTTYFPVEGKYGWWLKGVTDDEPYYRSPSRELHEDIGDCLLEAWDMLIGGKDGEIPKELEEGKISLRGRGLEDRRC